MKQKQKQNLNLTKLLATTNNIQSYNQQIYCKGKKQGIQIQKDQKTDQPTAVQGPYLILIAQTTKHKYLTFLRQLEI